MDLIQSTLAHSTSKLSLNIVCASLSAMFRLPSLQQLSWWHTWLRAISSATLADITPWLLQHALVVLHAWPVPVLLWA